jgi:hypothetical protein
MSKLISLAGVDLGRGAVVSVTVIDLVFIRRGYQMAEKG